MKTAMLLLFAAVTILPSVLRADSLASFDPKELAQSIASQIKTSGSRSQISNRISIIKIARNSSAKQNCQNDFTGYECFLDALASGSSDFHSSVLIAGVKISNSNANSLLENIMSYQSSWAAHEVNLNNDPQYIQHVREWVANTRYAQQPSTEKDLLKRAAHKLADPLVIWLAAQKINSVTRLALFSKAVSLYKDSFVALGVIGEMFDAERLSCDRKLQCVLGNKMTPLFAGGRRPNEVVYNAHFWAYLNLSLTGESGLYDRILTRIFDGRRHDKADSAASQLGLSVGRDVNQKILSFF